LKITPTASSGSLLSISVIIKDHVFNASIPTAFAHEYKGGLKTQEQPFVEISYTVNILPPETSPANRSNLTTTTLIYVDLVYGLNATNKLETIRRGTSF